MDDAASDDPQIMFGKRLRELRLTKGVSQMQLSFDAGLDHSYVSDTERGNRNVTLRNIYRLAKALGVAPEELLKAPSQSATKTADNKKGQPES